jgi:hypothetical protein
MFGTVSITFIFVNHGNPKLSAISLKIRGGVFVDVGANLGQTLIEFWLIDSGNSYIGFEPNEACIEYLETLININSLDGCKIIPVGLFNKNGNRPIAYRKIKGLGFCTGVC